MASITRHAVEVDDEVFALVQRHAEPLVDDFNSALRRLLVENDGVTVEGPGQTPRGRADGRSRSARGAGMGTRAAPGSILPEREYWVPILRALDELGGRGAAAQVTERVGELLNDRLLESDHALNATGEVRWKNRTAFARNSMKDAGLLRRDSPRGVWEMTDEGRTYLAESGKPR